VRRGGRWRKRRALSFGSSSVIGEFNSCGTSFFSWNEEEKGIFSSCSYGHSGIFLKCTASRVGSNCTLSDDNDLLLLNQKLLFCHTLSATPGGILDRAIDAEDRKHEDFMRLVNFRWIQ
jgi:hypothetical protein